AAGEVSRCLLCWISLMRGGGEPGIIERWKEVANQEPESSKRAIYGAIVVVFAELTGCVPQWQSALEGWNMRESTVVAEWKAEGRAEGIAEGIAEGRAQGMAQGIVEGRAQGMAQGKRSALLVVLEHKFGTPVPTDLTTTIETQ